MKTKLLKNEEDILFYVWTLTLFFIFLLDMMSDWSSFKSVKHLLLSVIVWWLMLISSPEIFLLKMVVGILITQAQKLMIASSSFDKDTCDQNDKLSTQPFPISWTYHHSFHGLLTAFTNAASLRKTLFHQHSTEILNYMHSLGFDHRK